MNHVVPKMRQPPLRAIPGISPPPHIHARSHPHAVERAGLMRQGERVVRGGKVVYFPCPSGAVRIIGLSESGEWIAEFACREQDFSDLYVRRMEQHVAEKTGVRIAVVG